MISKFVTLLGTRLHYLTAGQGPTLLLLHGTALDSARLSYGDLIPKLALDSRVVALDWPGYGQSGLPPRPYEAPFYEKVLSAFIDFLAIDKLAIAAFSMGAAVALSYALKSPDNLSHLILISAYGLGRSLHLPFLPRLGLKWPGLSDFLWRRLTAQPALFRLILQHLIFGRGVKPSLELTQALHHELKREDLKVTFRDWLEHELRYFHLRTNHSKRLPELSVPTLLVHGTRDLIIPAYRSRRAAKRIPKARFVPIKGGGHWLPREAETALLRAMRDFLSCEQRKLVSTPFKP